MLSVDAAKRARLPGTQTLLCTAIVGMSAMPALRVCFCRLTCPEQQAFDDFPLLILLRAQSIIDALVVLFLRRCWHGSSRMRLIAAEAGAHHLREGDTDARRSTLKACSAGQGAHVALKQRSRWPREAGSEKRSTNAL